MPPNRSNVVLGRPNLPLEVANTQTGHTYVGSFCTKAAGVRVLRMLEEPTVHTKPTRPGGVQWEDSRLVSDSGA
jgi:hypothetical protein